MTGSTEQGAGKVCALPEKALDHAALSSKDARVLAWYPILAVGVTGAAFSCIKTGRDAIFFTKTGLADLPIAYFWTEIGLALAALIHLSAMRRWGTRRVRTGVFGLTAILFLGFVPFARPERREWVEALFPLVPVLFAALFSTAWLLAGDLLEGAERRFLQKAYGWIGASAMLGGIAGGLLAREMARGFAPHFLIAAGAVLLIGGAVVSSTGHKKRDLLAGRSLDGGEDHEPDLSGAATPPIGSPESPGEGRAAREPVGTRSLLHHPYTRALLLISGLATLAAMYVEFQFYAAAFHAGKAGAQFFADYYVFVCVASLAFQVVVTPWIQSRYGVSSALLILPSGVLGGAGLVALSATVLTQSTFRIIETSLKNSVHRSSWEQVFLEFDRDKRGVIKVMIDGMVPRLSGVLGALGLYVLIRAGTVADSFGPSFLAWVLLPVAVLWVITTRSLRRLGATEPERARSRESDVDVRLPDS